MFATLLGPLPRPPLADDARVDDLVEAALRAQEAAGLEPVTDGGFRSDEPAAQAWRATAGLTDRVVKATLLGPYTRSRAGDDPATTATRGADRQARLRDLADALRDDLRALARAGCPIVEIHEPDATRIGTDEAERALFREAHERALDGLDPTTLHLSLAITGGNADAAGVETLLAAPYASLAVDLIDGPENWRLVVATPGDRGIVCGAVSARAGSDDGPEAPVWAAAYAASTGRRGPDRVGLAIAGSMAALPWAAAVRKVERLGEAAQLATLPPEELRHVIDPRAVDIRSAALGRYEPRPPTRRRQHRDTTRDTT
jgi:methionine synthase II (cobalamin-independent)